MTNKESGLSFIKCAEKVLEELGKEKPMHYKEITDKALKAGWLITGGRTPELTMNAQILSTIKRQEKRGQKTTFIKYGKGLLGLNKWAKQGLVSQIEKQNAKVKDELLQLLKGMKPGEFEKVISNLLGEMGLEAVSETPLSRDGGIDVRGELVVGDSIRVKIAVQVKRWKQSIGSPIVQQVRGSLGAHEQGLIVTTSGFTSGAIKEAIKSDKQPISLINGKQLVELLVENDMGVNHTSKDLLEINKNILPDDNGV